MREKRNKLLFEIDCKMTIDFPHKEGEQELWTQYRIELRNLPEIWVNNISSFPEKNSIRVLWIFFNTKIKINFRI
jgi:hypothetical protein